MMRILKQLVLESFRSIAGSKEFKNAVYEMVYKAVFGTLETINKVSWFLYIKFIEIGELMASKINSLIKRIPPH